MPEASDAKRIPLFPLNVVLFPGSRLPLRIFEPRYRRLFDDSLRQGGAFGVVLIKEGLEVGGPATPFNVGTMAEVESVDYRDDAIFLLCRGTNRFRIEALHRDQPYLSATVRVLPEPASSGPEDEKTAKVLRRRFLLYLERLQAVAKALGGDLKVPSETPAEGPRATANHIAFALPMDLEEKQGLLEEGNLAEILQRLGRRLDTELAFMEHES